jgi:membrane fusion protein, multidrug efflux system
MTVHFREGQDVAAGDLLAEIDPRPFQVQLEQAEGQMARDQATLANARLDLSRYQTLIQEEAIPRQQLDTQAATVAQTEATIKSDQAAIDSAKLNLTYCRITSPIPGRVGLRLVDPGNIVHAADANGLLVITQMQPITAVFTLPEDTLDPVLRKSRAGIVLPVSAYNRDRSKLLETGQLLTADNEIDPTTGTLRLKAVFENRDRTLIPNEFVNVRLLVDTLRGQVIVPTTAIQRGAQGTFAYVIKPDHTVEARPVTEGITEQNSTSVTAGLKAGELVVTDGADKLQPGSKVTVRSEPGQPSKPQPGDPVE